MTLPASGTISLAQIAAEFGLASTAHFPSAFYGLGGAPSSGTLKFSDFYGRSAYTPPATINGNSYAVNNEAGGARVTVNANGKLIGDGDNVGEQLATWLTAGAAADVQVFFSKVSGSGSGTPTNTGSWLDASTSPFSNVSAPPGLSRFATVKIDFRNKTTLAALGSVTVDLSAINF